MKKIVMLGIIFFVVCMCACANGNNANEMKESASNEKNSYQEERTVSNETSEDVSDEQDIQQEEMEYSNSTDGKAWIERINSVIADYNDQIAGLYPEEKKDGFHMENDENNVGVVKYYDQDNDLVKVRFGGNGTECEFYYEKGALICYVYKEYLCDLTEKYYFKEGTVLYFKGKTGPDMDEEMLQYVELQRCSNGETLTSFWAPFEAQSTYTTPENESMVFYYDSSKPMFIMRDAAVFLNNMRMPA